MERYTMRLPDDLGAVPVDGYGTPEIIDRLAAYEETGLEPGEIKSLYRKGEESKPADVVEMVRCKDCKHRPYPNPNRTPTGAAIGWDCYSDDEVCPYVCDDPAYTTIPADNSFCDRGERR